MLYIITLNDCKNPFLIHLSIIPEPWPWICLTTTGLPRDRWVVADLDSLSQTQSPHSDLTSLDSRSASSPWTCLVARIAGWPGSHHHFCSFPLVWAMGIAALPAPPSFSAASPTGLAEYPSVAASWQSPAVKQAADTAVYWAPADADG